MAQSSLEVRIGSDNMTLNPNVGRVIVEPEEGIKSKHIIIPESHKMKHQGTVGTIIAVGSPEGFRFQPGEKVIYSRYAGVLVHLASEKSDKQRQFLILDESDVLMSVKEDKVAVEASA